MPNGKFRSGLMLLLAIFWIAQPVLFVRPQDPLVPGYSFSPSIIEEGQSAQSRYASSWSETKPVKGVLTLIVIAVEFSDRPFKTSVEQLNVIFQNLRKYIEEISYGQATVQSKVQGVYHLSRSMFSYGWDNGGIDGDPSGIRTYQLVQDAIDKADLDVNFENYEYLMVVHAGEGQESTPSNPENIWSVTYVSGVWFTTRDQKSYSKAATVPEKEARGADVLGPIAHEFGHLLGLPDLYNAGKDASEGDAGKWDLMARGLWNGNPPGSKPAHPTAWCKLKLGWIRADQVKQVDTGHSSTEYLGPVEAPEGDAKVVIIPLSDDSYYFVECRSRFYDPYLPNEGVLIMKIDQQDLSRERGPITLVCAHSGSDNATFRLGEYYLNRNQRVLVSPRFADNKTFGIDFFRCQYAAIKISTPFRGASFFIDGKPCSASPSGTTIVFVNLTSHSVSVPNWIVQDRNRLLFVCWNDGLTRNERTVQAASNVTLSVVCKRQALLTVRSSGVSDFRYSGTIQIDDTPYSLHDSLRIDLWMDVNKMVRVFIVNSKVEAERDVQYVFKGWQGLSLNSTELNMRMSQPTELVAKFGKQYYLRVKSQFGNPVGEGWYDDGARATIQVSSPQYLNSRDRSMFECWSGDYSGNEPIGTLIMEKPSQVTGQWRHQYLTSMRILDYRGRSLCADGVKALIEAPNGTQLNGPLTKDFWLDNGVWKIRGVTLMGVDVSPPDQTFMPSSEGIWSVRVRAFALTVRVSTRLLITAISGASIHIQLPQGGPAVLYTNASGIATFYGLPSGKYGLNVVKDGGIATRATVELVDDVYLWLRIDDLLESIVMIGVMALASLSMGVLVIRIRRSSRTRRRPHRAGHSANVKEVYDYIIRHEGVISKSTTSQELGISQKALNQAIRRLLDSGSLKSC